MKIKIKKLNEKATLPRYAKKGDAGMDIFSCEEVMLKPGERKLISTGISMEIPEGNVALVWDKSGIAGNHGIKTMAGVIDSSYRGEIKIVILNTSDKEYSIKHGDKICQILIQPVVSAEIVEVSELEETERGSGGFGSTGIR